MGLRLIFLLHFFPNPILLFCHSNDSTLSIFLFFFLFLLLSSPSWEQESVLFKAGCPTGRIYSVTRKKVLLFPFFFFFFRLGRKQPCVVETIFDCRLNTQAIALPRRIGRQGNRVARWENDATRHVSRSLLQMGKPGPRVNVLAPSLPLSKICLFVLPNLPGSGSCILD